MRWPRPGTLLPALLLAACDGGNRPPALAPVPDPRAFAGEPVELALSGRDPDGDRLRFELGGLPEAATLERCSPTTARLRWTPAPGDASRRGRAHDGWIVARDGRGGRDEASFRITVFPALGRPRFELPETLVISLARRDTVRHRVTVLDPDSDAVAIALVEGPDGARLEPVGPKAARLVWTPNAEQREQAVHRLRLRADDGEHPPLEHLLRVVLLPP